MFKRSNNLFIFMLGLGICTSICKSHQKKWGGGGGGPLRGPCYPVSNIMQQSVQTRTRYNIHKLMLGAVGQRCMTSAECRQPTNDADI